MNEVYNNMKDILASFAYHIARSIASLIKEVSEEEIVAVVQEAWENVHPTE